MAGPNMRRMIRVTRLLSELGHTDVLDALDELARLRRRDAQWIGFALEVGKRVGCLASTFPDANDHVLRNLPPNAGGKRSDD